MITRSFFYADGDTAPSAVGPAASHVNKSLNEESTDCRGIRLAICVCLQFALIRRFLYLFPVSCPPAYDTSSVSHQPRFSSQLWQIDYCRASNLFQSRYFVYELFVSYTRIRRRRNEVRKLSTRKREQADDDTCLNSSYPSGDSGILLQSKGVQSVSRTSRSTPIKWRLIEAKFFWNLNSSPKHPLESFAGSIPRAAPSVNRDTKKIYAASTFVTGV